MTRRDKRPRKGGDAADPRPAGGRWRLRNWRLGTKLFAVLLIPALAVIALVGLRISSDLRDARQLAEFATRGRVDSTIAEALHELQRERDLTVRFVAQNRQGDTTDLTAQRNRVDQAIGTFERTLAESKPRLDAKAAESLQQTDDRLRVLGGLRFSAEHSAFPADAVLRSYSELISGLLDISDSAAADVADPELARMRLAGNALARIKDQMSVKRAVMAEALAAGTLNRDRTRALLGAEAELAAARSDYRTFATPDQQRMFDDTVIGLVVDIGNDMVESALTRTENDQNLSGLDPNQWDTSATHTVNLAHRVQQALLVQLQERTDALAAQARTAALWDGGVVLGVLLVAGVLSVVIARSLLRPLRILRRTALEVAEHRLPAAVQNLLTDPEPAPENLRKRLAVAPVPVFTREELGQVARAFDAVHGEAVRLAGEQAMLRENVNAMFVNLSQRSQDLVERQLSVLDRMEADEQDPDTLAGLFELDHLATRMRRNSENLLVLSGNDSAREDAGPVSADEIVGAALSEVEHYQRIELGPAPQVAVRGEAVNDLVHVISELLENATRYSGEEVVTVASAETHDGDWQIEIVDHGAGMPQAEIDRTNSRLAHPPDVDVEVSRRMGLFVVATLATRHHIDVSLSAGAESGLVATVLVPSALIVELPPMPAPPPPAEPPAAPEPELLAPLAPLAAPEPEPEPEPEELTPPSIEAGPPRRAPVVARDHTPEWPTVDDEAHLDLDAPTERMPAYRDVLSRWFDASAAPEQPRKPAEPRPVAEEPRPAEPQPRHALAPPPLPARERPPLPSRESSAPLRLSQDGPPPLPGESPASPLPAREMPTPPLPSRESPAPLQLSQEGQAPPPLPRESPAPPLPSRERPVPPLPARESPAPLQLSQDGPPPLPRESPAPPHSQESSAPPLSGESGVPAAPRPDDEDTEPRLTPVAPAAAIEPAYEWPTPAELEQEDGAEDTWPFLQPLDSAASPGAVPEQRPILSLSPEAVRERMTSLQGGFRRGRHARGDDTRNQ